MEIKDIIKEKREDLGLTMKEVAEKVGVNEGTVSRWESGNIKNMKRDKVAALSNILDIPPEILMGWTDKPISDKKSIFRSEKEAKLAKQMYDDKDMQWLYKVKGTMGEEAFSALIDYMKKMYALQHKSSLF